FPVFKHQLRDSIELLFLVQPGPAHDSIRLRVRQWTQEHRVDDTENRCTCANAQRQRHHASQRKTGTLQQTSNTIANVFDQRFNEIISKFPIADCQFTVASTLSFALCSLLFALRSPTRNAAPSAD